MALNACVATALRSNTCTPAATPNTHRATVHPQSRHDKPAAPLRSRRPMPAAPRTMPPPSPASSARTTPVAAARLAPEDNRHISKMQAARQGSRVTHPPCTPEPRCTPASESHATDHICAVDAPPPRQLQLLPRCTGCRKTRHTSPLRSARATRQCRHILRQNGNCHRQPVNLAPGHK